MTAAIIFRPGVRERLRSAERAAPVSSAPRRDSTPSSKELLQAFTAGDPEARERVRAALPDKPRIALADAQFVLAREYGFTDWSALRQHIDTLEEQRRPPHERIAAAFRRRDFDAVRRIFQQQPALRKMIDAPIFSFNAPAIVHCANDAAMVDLLLEFGADPNRRSEWWAGPFHALHVATGDAATRLLAAGAIPDACAAAHLDRVDVLARMIDEDPARVHERGGDGQTPLHFAQSHAAVDLLLEHGADIDARDVDHRSTPAEWMLDRHRGEGRYALATYLVERGASADIFLAAALGLTDRVRELIDADPSLLDLRTGQGRYAAQPPSAQHIYLWTIGDSRSPLDTAAQFDQHETLELLLGFASPTQRFMLACRQGDETVARAALRDDPSLMARLTADDRRALADAAWNGQARPVALMLDLGFDPRITGHDSGTALHCASWQGSPDTVAALLRHRDAAELVAIKDAHYGATPLGWCCHGSRFGPSTGDHAAVARLLLAAGARPGADTAEASEEVEAVLGEL
ncbi:MAG: ankyrin repeat domain-containing protein [Gemmatimonadetes bacterium]|nr:ankyrin repeat domain-containing protein [Gemmatimonadota bacterium]